MKDILSYAVGAAVSFLPPRYRPEVDRGPGGVSGIVETVLALIILIVRAIVWTQARTDVDIRTATVIAGSSVPGSGIFVLVEFWMNALHVLLFDFTVEGDGANSGC